MKNFSLFVLNFSFAALAAAATVPGLESYGNLTLVDSVTCATDATHVFGEYPSGASYVTNILGSACRAMEHANGHGSYFSYRLGRGNGLVPGDMYLLVAEYPDDAPRTATLINRAMDSRNGFHTGWTVGDTLNPHIITQTHPESMSVPLSGEFKRIEQLMVLNEKVYTATSTDSANMLSSATDGFDVVFQLFAKADALDSAGVAIKSISLYHVDNEASVAATINYPAGAPKRYVTWREEMSQESGHEMNADRYQNARIKTRLMKALGFNCFSRDMLEFGYNQWWDVTCGGKYSAGWYRATEDYYTSEIAIYGAAGVYLMPYYEYSGSRGPTGLGISMYRRATGLWDESNSDTHVNKMVKASNGASGANVDITDEAAFEDFRKVLECTMVRYKDQANFVGAWIRNRGSMPMSFSDRTMARFNADKGYTGSAAFSRASILAAQTAHGCGDPSRDIINYCDFCDEYNEYREWWYGKRADFFSDMQMYLQTNGMAGAKVFYSGVADESGVPLRAGTYYNTYFEQVGVQDTKWAQCGCTRPYATIGQMAGYYLDYGLHRDTWTFWPYEYNHAAPQGDPYNYTNRADVAIAYPYNTCYSAVVPGVGDEYRNASGDVFFTRHYCLYEGANHDANDHELNGYYTCEMDRADRAIMLPELYAVAYQDPTTIAYLQGNQLARNFTRPVREFNENFLSLPAVKGRVLQGGGWGLGNPTIRKYEVNGEEYYAVINVTGDALPSQWRYFTDTPGTFTVYETVSGAEHTVGSQWMRFDMEPYQIKCFSTVKPGMVQKIFTIGAPTASVSTNGVDAVISIDVTQVVNTTGDVTLTLNGTPVKTWSNVSSACHLEFECDATPYATNVYSFAATHDGDEDVAGGRFETRVYTEWFRVEFGAGTVACDGQWTLPSSGTATLAPTNGVNAYVFREADCLRYVPSSPSESGANVDVKGKVMVSAGSVPGTMPVEAKAGLCFEGPGVISVYGYGANGWRELHGAPALSEGDWVDYAITYDLTARTITYSIGNATLTPSQPLFAGVDRVNAVRFSGNGAISDFRGAYHAMQALTPPIEIIKPVFDGQGGGLGSGTRQTPQGTVETFSVTITNPVKGAYYTVFTAETLPGPFVAEYDSVRIEDDLATHTFTVDADTPAKFLRIVASDEPFEAGDELQ